MKKLTTVLLSWYKNNKRSYPWREKPSAYKIMIAEFMLQRTRADQVVPVYVNFLNKYPDVKSLSNADIADIAEIIKPLGLHWRSAHFKKAAECILSDYRGIIPSSREELLKMPGIGNYVAGVILAIAFSKNAPIVDSNIARVLNRYFGLELIGEIRRNKRIVEKADELFSRCNCKPKEMLFAIIDFSALVCTPINPKHEICPLKNDCKFTFPHASTRNGTSSSPQKNPSHQCGRL